MFSNILPLNGQWMDYIGVDLLANSSTVSERSDPGGR